MRWDWDDVRVFLAVADTGSALAGGRALGMNQTTAARRLTALEDALQLRLFDRSATGYALTVEGEALLGPARTLAEAARRFGQAAGAARESGLGTLRLSATDGLAEAIVAPAIARFRVEHPGVAIELDISNRFVDLAAGEADIAVRSGEDPGTAVGVIQRRLPPHCWGVYCSRDYAAARGRPRSMAEVALHPVATLGGAPLAWLRAHHPELHITDVTNSIAALCAVLGAGYCIGGLPCVVGDRAAGLERCFRIPDEAATWLVYAERLRGRPEARAFLDFLIAHFEAQRALLVGE